MFFGSYQHNLDEKNRLMIPRKMRESLSSKLYIMKGFDGAISIFEENAFTALMNQFNTLSFNKKDARSYLRTELANTYELEVDKLGRIQLPTALINKYKISKDVTVLGAGDHIEIWNTVDFEAYQQETEPMFEEIAEKLDKED